MRLIEQWAMTEWIMARFNLKAARYLISVLALVVAAVLTVSIIHFNLPRQITGYAFLLVIIGSAWWGGYGPGLLTTSATLLLGPYLTQPAYSIRHPNVGSAPMVVLISVLISRMAGVRQTLKKANDLLDERVRQRTIELEAANGALRDREAQLIAQAERLSESNADLEQFTHFASHDLQEPLRMIAIYTELLSENQRSNSDAGPIPSYLLECLVWNVPNEGFGHDAYRDDVRYALAHLCNDSRTDELCKEWREVNELKYLLRGGQPWSRSQVNTFLNAAWNYVGFK
jgi:signal transduction histidine kinase